MRLSVSSEFPSVSSLPPHSPLKAFLLTLTKTFLQIFRWIFGIWLVCIIAIHEWNEWWLSSIRARSQIMQSELHKSLWWKLILRSGQGAVIQAELFTDFSDLLFLQLFASVYVGLLGNHGEGRDLQMVLVKSLNRCTEQQAWLTQWRLLFLCLSVPLQSVCVLDSLGAFFPVEAVLKSQYMEILDRFVYHKCPFEVCFKTKATFTDLLKTINTSVNHKPTFL